MNEKNTSQSAKNYTVEDYLNIERSTPGKHDFRDGQIVAAAGSNRIHNLIGSNATIAIGSRLQGQKCELYVNDMRVQISPNRISYPDVVIVNGTPAFKDADCDVLLNPTIAIEIFSKNTGFVDKTEKLESYLAMNSIREYVLIKEDEMRVEHYTKQNAKQWIYRIYNERDDVVSLDAINCKISMTEIYAQIKFRETEIKSQAVN